MATIEINHKSYKVEGELPNGFFYLSGPRGGDVHFAKPVNGNYAFYKATGGLAVQDSKGLIVTATREELVAA